MAIWNTAAILFPIVFVYALFHFFPVDPRYHKILTQEATSGVVRRSGAPLSPAEKFLELLMGFGCGLGFALIQFAVFYLVSGWGRDFLFESRMSSAVGYAIIVGLVLGLSLARVLQFYLIRRGGVPELERWLRRTDGGSTLHHRYSFARVVGLSLGSFCVLANFVAYNTFLTISHNDIEVKRWRAFTVTRMPARELARIRIHNQRLVGMGRTREIEFVELVFDDGSTIDTAYLVSPARTTELVEALKRVARVPVEHVPEN